MSRLWTALSVPKAWGVGWGWSYRSCSFDSSTWSLISDLDTNHARALGCTTVREQITGLRRGWRIFNALFAGDQFCWWLATPISNQINFLLAMGETCIMCQVAMWFAKPCRERFPSEVLPFHFLLLLSISMSWRILVKCRCVQITCIIYRLFILKLPDWKVNFPTFHHHLLSRQTKEQKKRKLYVTSVLFRGLFSAFQSHSSPPPDCPARSHLLSWKPRAPSLQLWVAVHLLPWCAVFVFLLADSFLVGATVAFALMIIFFSLY